MLQQYGAVPVKDVVSKEMANFFTHVLLRKASYPDDKKGDEQIPNAKAILGHEYMFETLLEATWHKLESIIGEELLPTYSYARLYSNGNVLEKHKDRPECEISLTVQLGRSHHYSWPIFMGGKRYDLGEGDGIIYRGCDIEHWRDKCDGPDDYYSGQVFLHYVRVNGPYKECAGDVNTRNLWPDMFSKYRNFQMENK